MDLKDLYREVILDHNKSPRLFGRLEPADSSADGHNPLCGDRLHITVRLDGDVVSDLRFEGKLTRDASFEATSVSGDMKVRAPAEGGYSYDLSSFSGDIENCFGARSDKSGAVGHSLSGTLGAGAGHVRLKTMSGDIELCDRT